MNKYIIKMELLSEAIFGSGHAIPGSVDLEVVYDELGIPYMKAKTFKGNLRENMEKIIDMLGEEYKSYLNRLLGKENSGTVSWRTLKFSDCKINENIRLLLENKINNKKITPKEVKEALTEVRSFTSIDKDGSYNKSSLRQMRVIKKGLVFETIVESELELNNMELGILAASVRMMKNVGTMRTRGKGEVDCKLFTNKNGKTIDITDKYIKELMKEVRKIG